MIYDVSSTIPDPALQARYLPGVDFEALFEELDMPGLPSWCRFDMKNVSKKTATRFLVIPQLSHVFNLVFSAIVAVPSKISQSEASLLLQAAHFQHPSHLQGAYSGLAPRQRQSSADGKTRPTERWITGMFTSTEGLVDELVRRLRIRAFGGKPHVFHLKSFFPWHGFLPAGFVFCRCFWPHLNFFKCFFFRCMSKHSNKTTHTHTTAVTTIRPTIFRGVDIIREFDGSLAVARIEVPWINLQQR